MKLNKGNPPDSKEWFKLASTDTEYNGSIWTVYVKPEQFDNWINFKIISESPIKGSANYYLGYNLKEQRYSDTADMFNLNDSRHFLYLKVMDIIKGYIDG